MNMAFTLDEGGYQPEDFLFSDKNRGFNRTVDRFKSLGYQYIHAQPGDQQARTCSEARQ